MIKNLLGYRGSYISDLFFQSVGLISFLISFTIFFTGINYDMAEYLRIGLRYRWMRVGEMKLFTARELHLAELSLGYVF